MPERVDWTVSNKGFARNIAKDYVNELQRVSVGKMREIYYRPGVDGIDIFAVLDAKRSEFMPGNGSTNHLAYRRLLAAEGIIRRKYPVNLIFWRLSASDDSMERIQEMTKGATRVRSNLR